MSTDKASSVISICICMKELLLLAARLSVSQTTEYDNDNFCLFLDVDPAHQEQTFVPHLYIAKPPLYSKTLYSKTPLYPTFISLYSKTWVCTGITIFLIFDPKHTRRLWVLVRTASARRFYRVPTTNVEQKI